MTESNGVLLFEATKGLSYQIAGALARLGKRVLSIEPPNPLADPNIQANPALAKELKAKLSQNKKETSYIPLQSFEESTGDEAFWKENSSKFTSFIWESTPTLTFNQDLNEREWNKVLELARNCKTFAPHIHGIWLLPLNANPLKVEKLQKTLPESTIILSPQCWGFEDRNLFDNTMTLRDAKPGVLLKTFKEKEDHLPHEWVSFDDIAAQVVVTAGQESFYGKIIKLEGQNFSKESWRQEFKNVFPVEVDIFERWASKLSNDVLKITLSKNNTLDDSKQTPNFVVESSRNIFPIESTPLKRNLSKIARAIEHYPELKQVFTPSRAI